ncbi:AbrB/MazE/SpoVT family DNA-binding domain-containing protein [Tetragenococcus halophilus]|uniref:AbrB/MazE/SpoVT family DNA-binding domain-containing protein n=1 Tax=Tetragenococcus halophilus TaxID=51669 RepID=UPI001B6203A9|nr:hypothetical protein [Tetragenococcus halophilus]MCO7026472.1 hypothetical protein [Tetragenococcus halophilus]GLL51780.1 hypothetical protein YA5_017580 [Tetragenococcus halophilus]GMG68147.1 hypothetical protein TEHMS4_10820 [Tetragenococcus halophilus]
MEIMRKRGKIKKWGNTKGIVLPKAILSNADLKNIENVNITVETQPDGKKRIVIEDVTEDKKELLEDLVGTVNLPKDLDVKTERAERKQKRLVKHELHH